MFNIESINIFLLARQYIYFDTPFRINSDGKFLKHEVFTQLLNAINIFLTKILVNAPLIGE